MIFYLHQHELQLVLMKMYAEWVLLNPQKEVRLTLLDEAWWWGVMPWVPCAAVRGLGRDQGNRLLRRRPDRGRYFPIRSDVAKATPAMAPIG
jgi:hypothetical protein